MKNKQHPESLMMSYGYKPELSEGSIKSPIFQTSTFVFKSAEEGKAFFEIQNKKRKKRKNENVGLIYSRMNNPDMEILENRLTLWDGAEDCCVFESGMAAITTVLLEFLKPGDLLVYSIPLYGGTEHFIDSYLTDIGVHSVAFKPTHSEKEIVEIIKATGKADKFSLMFIETPSNPTSTLIDISMCKKIADKFSTNLPAAKGIIGQAGNKKVYLACDNTYMGPLWQHPLKHGADFSLYSATKYIGGHSDLIAGACLGNKELMSRVRSLRSQLGNMAAPWTSWLMMRSLETLKIRMEQ
ncbi:MAG: PLP-dependent transferase, partial [Bacteroidia bacterium]